MDRGPGRRARTWSGASSASSTSRAPGTSWSTARSSSSATSTGSTSVAAARSRSPAPTPRSTSSRHPRAPPTPPPRSSTTTSRVSRSAPPQGASERDAVPLRLGLGPPDGNPAVRRHRPGRRLGVEHPARRTCTTAAPRSTSTSTWPTTAGSSTSSAGPAPPGTSWSRNRQAVISPAVVHPRRCRHQLVRLHLGDVRGEHDVHRPRARRAGGRCDPGRLRPVRHDAPS